MTIISEYEVVVSTTAQGLQQQVRQHLPNMQPLGGPVTDGRHVMQALTKTGVTNTITNGTKLEGIDIDDGKGDVTFTVVNGVITGITLDIQSAP